jgi:hypothetical protein
MHGLGVSVYIDLSHDVFHLLSLFFIGLFSPVMNALASRKTIAQVRLHLEVVEPSEAHAHLNNLALLWINPTSIDRVVVLLVGRAQADRCAAI